MIVEMVAAWQAEVLHKIEDAEKSRVLESKCSRSGDSDGPRSWMLHDVDEREPKMQATKAKKSIADLGGSERCSSGSCSGVNREGAIESRCTSE